MEHEQHDDAMRSYYAARAPAMRYDQLSVTDQSTLEAYADFLREELGGRRVLEVACGTGYWAQVVAETAEFVLATDAVPEMLELARRRNFPRANVDLLLSDAYSLSGIRKAWNAGFHFQWISHVPKSRLHAFFARFHSRLVPGARVVFGDNIDRGTEPDEEGNLYQRRTCAGMADYKIIKNCPSEEELEAVLEPWAAAIRHVRFDRDWFVSYDLAA